jgi:hypothetical protein
MQFQKENTNGKGRILGSKNINTAEIRNAFQLLLQNNILQLEKDLLSLEPKDRVNSILSIAKFILPTLKSVDLTDTSKLENDFKPIVINLTSQEEVKRMINEFNKDY